MFTKSGSPLYLCSVVLLIMYLFFFSSMFWWHRIYNSWTINVMIKSDMDTLEVYLVCLNFIKASVINSATVLLLLPFTMVNLDPMCKQKQWVSDIQNWSFHWRVTVQKTIAQFGVLLTNTACWMEDTPNMLTPSNPIFLEWKMPKFVALRLISNLVK